MRINLKHVLIGGMLISLSACANGTEQRLFGPSVSSSGSTASAKPVGSMKNGGLFSFLNKKPVPAPNRVVVAAPIESEQPVVADTIAVAPSPILSTEEIAVAEIGADVLSPVPSMTDAEIAARGPGPGVLTPPKRPGLLGFLRNNSRNTVKVATVSPSPSPESVAANLVPAASVPSMTDEEIAAAGNRNRGVDEVRVSDKPRLFSFLNKRIPGETNGSGSNVVLASAPANGTLFGGPRRVTAPAGPLNFGDFVSACGVKKRDLGVEVARSHGAGTYILYDTNPSSIAPRFQYITGFKDKCPRKFMAALTMFGAAQVHETKRYYKRNSSPYSPSDDAYERAKNRVCRVGKGEPCPADRFDKLEKQVAFLTVYRGFGTTDKRMEVVLFNGKVAGRTVH